MCALIGGTACAKDPVDTVQTNNQGVSVDILFEKDGYRVHRFKDAGHYIYYVVPNGQVHTAYTEGCGKGCTREQRSDSYTLPN